MLRTIDEVLEEAHRRMCDKLRQRGIDIQSNMESRHGPSDLEYIIDEVMEEIMEEVDLHTVALSHIELIDPDSEVVYYSEPFEEDRLRQDLEPDLKSLIDRNLRREMASWMVGAWIDRDASPARVVISIDPLGRARAKQYMT
jgi:hypothetical protein